MVLVLNAKVKTLVLAIKGNVVVDSEIYIYCFKSYAMLIAEGYLLRIVNHNVDFVGKLGLIEIVFANFITWKSRKLRTQYK